LICQLARREVTVALSGDGGDELFAGYNRYRFGRSLLGIARRVPSALRRPFGRLAEAVSRSGGDLRSRMGKLRKAGQVLSASGAGVGYRTLLSAWQNPGELANGVVEESGVFVATIDRPGDDSLLGRMMLADQMSYLPDDLLAKVDRASMAVSLEARAPILDHRVIEFSWRLPDDLKMHGNETKWILRQVLHRRVPQALVDRPKMGFSVPISAWLRGPLRSWGDDLLADPTLAADGLLDPRRCARAWSALQGGQEHRSLSLWALLVFLDWRRRWLA
jgi:asparagine synthase (glutamine-hydrolysing)